MRKTLLLLLALLISLLLISCNHGDQVSSIPETDPLVTQPSEPTPAEIYQEAADRLEAETDVKLKVDWETTTSVGGQDFTEKQTLTLSMSNIGSEDFVGKAGGVIRYTPEFSVLLEEYTFDDQVSGSLESFYYTAAADDESFFERYCPAVLLDPCLYSSVEFTDDTTITFFGATQPEQWLGLEEDVQVSGEGTVTLTDGKITESSYHFTYTVGSAQITSKITVTPEELADAVAPPDLSLHTYMPLDDPDIPRIVSRSKGNILQSQSLSMSNTYSVTSAAAYAVVSVSETLDMVGPDETLLSQYTYLQNATDYSSAQSYSYTYEESFKDGVISYTENDADPISEDGYTGSEVRSAFLYSTAYENDFLNLGNVSSLKMSEVPGGYVLDFTYNDAYTKTLNHDSVSYFFEDGSYLDSLAENYDQLFSEGYCSIDAVTGLPIAYYTYYSATHQIEGKVYPLQLERSILYDCASQSARRNITDEPLEVDTESTQPTPLFYKVTGNNGESMWLLGTIHVGDSRTGNLPAPIYTALDESDALALEYDMNQFDRQLEEDPDLMQQVLSTYIYADGSSIVQHIGDTQVYSLGKQLMKFSGQYSINAERMRPSVWGGIIENFYLDIGYRLSSDYGVDMQLLCRAEEQGKTVLNVESGVEQARMFSTFSDGLQEYLLASVLGISPAEYNANVEELFEMWCAGDEAALTEFLNSQEDLSGQELAYAQEYKKAIETDRNAAMLEVAKGYLNSGDTVFYAVGLAHLLAEDGLVNTLRAAGYTVELVTYE